MFESSPSEYTVLYAANSGVHFCVREQSEGSAMHMAHAARTKCLRMLLFVHVFRILRFY